MRETRKSVADLKPGEKGMVCCFKDEVMSLKLMEMGCLPGSQVELAHKAPFGDPICIHVGGYSLSLRLKEASTIMLME
jgi:ferrous iron transport protein A